MMTLMTSRPPRPPVQASLTLLVGVIAWTGVQLTTPTGVAAYPTESLAEREAVTCIAPRIALLNHEDAPACAPLSGEAFHRASQWAKRTHSADQAILASPTCSVDELHTLRRPGYIRQGNVIYGTRTVVAGRDAISSARRFPAFDLLQSGSHATANISSSPHATENISSDPHATENISSGPHATENMMCRRGAKRGNQKGPNPWLEDALTVRLGPQISPANAMHDQNAPIATVTASSGMRPMYIAAQDVVQVPLNPSYAAMTPLPLKGLAMYYNPGVMREVVEYRENMGEIQTCDECIGFAALLRAGDLNRKIWIQWADGTIEGPFLVADVAARHHVDMLIQRGWAIDVDNQTAVRRGMFQPVAVTVHAAPPVTVD